MAKFRKKEKREVPQPPSGSLSDIVFMLLFFFMVTTTMRETENKVNILLPEASEIVKLERKAQLLIPAYDFCIPDLIYG